MLSTLILASFLHTYIYKIAFIYGMHRVYLSFLILFLGILSVHAQYTIEGSVLDANTSSAIEMSTVRLYRVSTTDTLFVEGCQTGAEGRFVLRDIPNGDYFVLVSNIGYKEQKTPVRINGSNISIKAGEEKITTEGKNGLKEITYTEKLVNGESVKKEVTKTVTLTKAVAKTVTVGTKTSKNKGNVSTLSPKKEIELDENGVPVNYKSKMTVRATAYTHTGNRCSTGVKPQPGYIAVNPKVIPYGTEMFIKTTDGKYIYGYAVAADTGGFIKKHPTGVDLFFNTQAECVNFGVRTAEIYILN